MAERPNSADSDEIRNLLRQYNNLRDGGESGFLEEEAFEKIINYFDDNDQLGQAIEAAECGIMLFPYSSLLLIKKADLLIAQQKFEDSLNTLKKAELLDHFDINLFILKAEAYLGLHLAERSRRILQEGTAVFKGDDKVDFLFEMSDVFDDYEQLNDVFECLKLILAEDPENQEALYKICFWADYTGKQEESIRIHKRVIDEKPYNHLAWFNLGCAYEGLKLYESAIDAYQFAIAIDEKFEYAYRNLGDAYIRIRKYKEAIEALEKVLELSIPEDVIYEALGHCHEKLKNPVQARVQYRKAAHLNHEDSHLFYHIALTYMVEKNWKNAIQQLEIALNLSPRKAEFHFAIGYCYSKRGNTEDAVTHFLNYISVRQKNIKGWKALIICLYENGYLEEALKQADSAWYYTKGKPLFLYYRSAILIGLGREKEGLVSLQSALQLAPKSINEFVALDPALIRRDSVVRMIQFYTR